MGRFAANALGFHDMAGNVSEIAVPDEAELEEGSTFYTRLVRLVRLGGSWADPPLANVRSQTGKSTRSQSQRADVGFRCVLDLGGDPGGK